MAYIAMLFLLLVVTTLGGSYLLRTSAARGSAGSRNTSMQVQFLAETAANHALWRLLNEEDWTPSQTTYIMHDMPGLAGARYGYKVRPHSATAYATVATVGAFAGQIARHSYVIAVKPPQQPAGDIFAVFQPLGGVQDTVTSFRKFTDTGWDLQQDVFDTSFDVSWHMLATCLVKNESVLATLSADDSVRLAVFDGLEWSAEQVMGTNTNPGGHVAVAYEQLSGDVLAVARNGNSDKLYYRTKTGTGSTWSALSEGEGFGGSIEFVTLESAHTTNNIYGGVLNVNDDIHFFRWRGNPLQWDEKAKIEDNAAAGELNVVTVISYSLSQEALVIWGRAGDPRAKYRVYNGSNLLSEYSLPTFANDPVQFRGAAHPSSNDILLLAATSTEDLAVAVWDGTAWIDSRIIEGNLETIAQECFDVAWHPSGETALIVWSRGGESQLMYAVWTKGDDLDLANVQFGPDTANAARIVHLKAVPETASVLVVACTPTGLVVSTVWDGAAFSPDPPEQLVTLPAPSGRRIALGGQLLGDPLPPPMDIYVNDITMGGGPVPPKYQATALVWIKDGNGDSVSDAHVYGTWTGEGPQAADGPTGVDGKAMLTSKAGRAGTYTLTVTDVVKGRTTYVPALNVETSDSITLP